MSKTLQALLDGRSENHLMPFFWQHGEDEATLREYMGAIAGANCGAVCVESRPHPDFCGERWWKDMDIILDEARCRGMKVWILDDSHFPTGFANGAVKNAPPELHRQSVCRSTVELSGPEADVELSLDGLIPPPNHPVCMLEQYVLPILLKDAPHFEDDRVIALTAVEKASGRAVTLALPAEGEPLRWHKPAGDWTLWVIGLSRNCGPHREYINMLDPESCRLLIDAVYEPHWQHYAADFGTTIAGFFSDEPELGNGHLYCNESLLGTDQDLPFARTLPAELESRLGENWANRLYLLWDNDADPDETARVRHAYMDAVTKLVRESFSRQLGEWCRAHGVQYIGHMIEDCNAHARTGSSLGHYFRGLDGQDMAGIDDIGGQVLPQGEDSPAISNLGMPRDGTFYHFQLANLAASAAAIEPGKHGSAMCEIFGNYDWGEGVQLEKYLADHFLVRGINWFVPHAFDPAPFPDTDCPPHFYAHGHNPQYRHFGCLMAYMNRVATLTSGGHRIAPVALLYHGEAEWAGKAMLTEEPARRLAEAQIEYDTLPSDVFAEPEHYRTVLGNPLRVNTQEYRALVVPQAAYVTAAFARAAAALTEAGLPVYFLGARPQGVMDGDASLLAPLSACPVLTPDALVPALRSAGLPEVRLTPSSRHMRVMHYVGETELYFFVNEDADCWDGTVALPERNLCCWYDPWSNTVSPADPGNLTLRLYPRHSRMLIVGEAAPANAPLPPLPVGEALPLSGWTRAVCAAIEYPRFGEAKAVTLPDTLAEEQPSFSGMVRYETRFTLPRAGRLVLEITDAAEGVEVFCNGQSAGIQIVAPYLYDLTALSVPGANTLAIEVATTLERFAYDLIKDDPRTRLRGLQPPACGSGLTGKANLYLFTPGEVL